MTAVLVESAARATIPLVAGLMLTHMLRSRDPETRHTVWLMALFSAGAMGASPLMTPTWSIGMLPLPTMPGGALPADVVAEVQRYRVLGWLWLVPVTLLAGSLMLSVNRVGGWVRRGTELPGTHPARRLADTVAAPGIVRIVISDEAPVPFAWGLLRAIVVLPRDALEWSAADLRSALIHEIGHLHRRDVWSRLAAETLCCIYWFHPLVWLGVTRLREESEAACDALVLADGRPRSEYASQLVSLTQRIAHSRALASLAGPGRMRKRLERLLDAGAPSRTSRNQTRVLMGGWAIATVIGATSFQPTPVVRVSGPPRGDAQPPAASTLEASGTGAITVINQHIQRETRRVTRVVTQQRHEMRVEPVSGGPTER